MADNNDLTPDELAELQRFLQQQGFGAGYPVPDRDKGMVGFFRDLLDVNRIKNVIRGGNLLENEIIGSRLLLDTAFYAKVS